MIIIFIFKNVVILNKEIRIIIITFSEAGKLGAIKSAQIQKEQKALRIHEYNKNPNKCKFYNQSFSYEKRHNKFCNQSCAASYNNKLTKIKLYYLYKYIMPA